MKRWALIFAALLALILAPFFIFEDQFNALGARLVKGEGGTLFSAAAIGGLLAADVVLPVPSSVVSTAAGFLLGFWKGAAVCWAGMTIACWSGYWLGASASGWVTRFVGTNDIRRAAALSDRYGDWALVICRPIPVLAEASVVLAGTLHAGRGKFGAITAVSNLGIALGYAAIGAYSMKVESFLLAFGGAIAAPALALAALRVWQKLRG